MAHRALLSPLRRGLRIKDSIDPSFTATGSSGCWRTNKSFASAAQLATEFGSTLFSTPPTNKPLRELHPSELGTPQRAIDERQRSIELPTPTPTPTGNNGKPSTKLALPLRAVAFGLPDKTVEINPVILRDACKCSACVDPSSRQKLFLTSDIPPNISPESIQTDPNGDARIRWKNDTASSSDVHESVYSVADLKFMSLSPSSQVHALGKERRYQTWDASYIEENAVWVDYNDYLHDDEALFLVLVHLRRFGLAFLRNIPDEADAILDLARRIGELRNTFYGLTWDVRSIPDAKNIAYTAQYLGYHMDLLYFREPPTLQILHCIQNEAAGGESFWADSFLAAHRLYNSDKKAFTACNSFPVLYEYQNDGHHYRHLKPLFEKSEYDNSTLLMDHVNYSPPFQGNYASRTLSYSGSWNRQNALPKHQQTWLDYLRGIKAFETQISRPDAKYQRRMQRGEAMIFNNRRILHARNEFDPTSGERWFKGAYIDRDPYLSRYRTLWKKYGPAWDAAVYETRIWQDTEQSRHI